MPRYVQVDLTDAPPAQGSGGDHVPPGKYVLEIRLVSVETARSSGRPMYTCQFSVAQGAEGTIGKTLRDNFALPQTQQDSKFGLQRFHAFMLAVGFTISKPTFQLDLDLFTGRKVVAEVYDDTIPASGGYQERLVSKISSYFPLSSLQQNGAAAQSRPAPAPAPAPAAPAPAPTPADVALLSDDGAIAIELPEATIEMPGATIGVSTEQAAEAGVELDGLFAQ